jgi:hypothetical protein
MGRQKVNKPRRERPDHNHAQGLEGDHRPDFGGRPTDSQLLDTLVGAAIDGCTACQPPLLDQIAEDPTTTARLVSLACIATADALGGGLPDSLLDVDAPGLASQEFRRLALSGVDQVTETATATKMLAVADGMTPVERRAAADSALDLIAGLI